MENKTRNTHTMLRSNILYILFFLMFGLSALSSPAQSNQTTAGRDFWVAFIVNGSDQQPQQVQLSAYGDSACTVTVSNPLNAWQQTVSLNAGASVDIPLTEALAIPEHYSMTESKGFHVTSTADIYLMASITKLASTGVSSILPSHALGYRYVVLDYPADPSRTSITGATITILATEGNTSIQYTPPCALFTFPSDPPAPPANTPATHHFTFAGRTLTLRANTPNASLSGMVVTSDKPIAIFQGNQITGVPASTPSGDLMYDQALPVTLWGYEYALVPTVGRSVGDRVRVVADSACSVTLSTGSTFSLSQNEVHEFDLQANSPCILTATQPVSVGLCTKASDWNAEPGDASLLMVPPTEHGLCHSTFTTFSTTRISTWYLVAITEQPATMSLDGTDISSQFQPIGSTAYSYARISVSSGTHTLDNSNGLFNAWTYGVGNVESYIYSLGLAVDTIPVESQHEPQIRRDTVAIIDTVCQGQPYNNNGFAINTTQTRNTGVLHFADSTVVDDTIVHYRTLTLTVLSSVSNEVYINIPPNGTVTFADTTIADTGIYTFLFTTVNGCDSTVTLHVQNCQKEVCIKTNRDFIDFDHPAITLYDCSPDRYSSSWTFSDGYTLSGERAMHQFTHPLPDTVTVTLRSCNRDNCCADTTISFHSEIRSVWFPNIFTPGEPQNNHFGAITSCQTVEFEIFIYNRWGLLMFHSTDILALWDGTHDGIPVPQGAYAYRWYLKDIHGDRWSGTGTVTLLR